MAKTYTLSEADVADDQKTVTIKETKSVTQEQRVSVAQLKEQHAQKLEEIENLKTGADALADEMQAINDNEGIDLAVKDIPTKLIKPSP